jgi:hypothetical protein
VDDAIAGGSAAVVLLYGITAHFDRSTMSPDEPDAPVHQPTLWQDDGWTARVIKNEDDDGWAVSMTQDGQSEPALVGPWTMGRDKKNPKPLDAPAFFTLVKTASEVLRRHEQQRHAALHREVELDTAQGRMKVTLDITPDDDHPSAVLSAYDEAGQALARFTVAPEFRLTRGTAASWVEGGLRRPG